MAKPPESGRYGYCETGRLLNAAGWSVDEMCVERIWPREGLKVPARQPRQWRIWDNDGSCVHLRPEHRDHMWSYDFAEARTHDGRKIRMLDLVDEPKDREARSPTNAWRSWSPVS